MTNAGFRIIDYTNAQLVTFNTGWTRLQTGTYRIVHVINLDEYQETLDYLNTTIQQKIINTNPLLPFLKHEVENIQNNLDKLKTQPKHNKNKRSIKILGTAWKWLAGSPDYDDFRILSEKINNALENSNDQIIINRVLSERIKNITEQSNKILSALKNNENIQHNVAVNIKYKLDIIKEDIANINYAIHWAKTGTVNSYIFSNNEINLMKSIHENQNNPFNNIDEALEFSNVNVASNNSVILYVVNIPLTNKNTCESLLIKPIKKGNKINKIQFEKILICESKIFGKRNECEKHNTLEICNDKDIIDISNSSCIPNLLNSHPANCTTINNQHVSAIEAILPGILFLNQYEGSVTLDNEEMRLNGSYAIQFQNSTVIIDNQQYIFNGITANNPLPAILQPSNTINPEEEILSLEMMKELHLKNLKHIEEAKRRTLISTVTNFGVSSLLLVLIIGLMMKFRPIKENKLIGKYVKQIPLERMKTTQEEANTQSTEYDDHTNSTAPYFNYNT